MSVKEILDNLNISSYINIDNFFEIMLNKYGEVISYVSLKDKFINYFSKYSNFNEKNFEKISKETKINSKKDVNLIEFLIYINKIRNKEIISPLLLFYNLSYLFNKKYKIYTTAEYVTRNLISIDDEININEFLYKITNNLGLSDLMSLIIFKSLLFEKKGKIKVSDFINVTDSFRYNDANNPNFKTSKYNLKNNNELMNQIELFSNECKNKNINEIELFLNTFKKNNSNINFNSITDDNIKITLDDLKTTISEHLSNKNLDNELLIKSIYNINQNNILIFTDYVKLITEYKNEKLLRTTNTLQFEESERRFYSLPYKGNDNVFNKLKYEITKMINNFYLKRNINKMTKSFDFSKKKKNGVKKENEFILPSINLKDNNIDPNYNTFNNFSQIKQRSELIKSYKKDNLPELFNRWNMIDCLEKYIIPNGFSGSKTDLENYMINNLNDIPKNQINKICSTIDSDKDNNISYFDIINVLLFNYNYKSIILCWRYIASNLLYKNQRIENFFKKINLDLKSYVDSNQFNDVIFNEYSLDKSLIALMYDNLLEIIIQKFKRNVLVSDVRDKVQSEIDYLKMRNEKTKNNYKKDMKNEEENFQDYLTEHFTYLMNAFSSIENLEHYLNLKENMSLKDYKNSFIKKSNIKEIYGLKLFFHLKNNDSKITKQQLYNEIIKITKTKKINFNLNSLFKILNGDNKELYLIKCFEYPQYEPNGISSLNFLQTFKYFFPSFTNDLIKKIIMKIDKSNQGFIPYINLLHIINNNTNIKNSYNLVIKVICSYLDLNNYKTEETLQTNILIPLNEIMKYNSCVLFFNKLGLNTNEINVFINRNIVNLEKLINDINFIRKNKSNFKNEIDNKEMFEKLRYEISSLNINFEDISSLNIDSNLEISVNEIFRYLKKKINESKTDKETKTELLHKLLILLKCYDYQNSGMISYKNFYLIFKFTTPSFHMSFITQKILTDFNGDINNYIEYKTIDENKYMDKNEYEFLFFEEEMISENKISDDLFAFFQIKNMFYVKNYVNYINFEKENISFNPINEEDIDNNIQRIILTYENNYKQPFYLFYNEIKLDNKYGNINTDIIKKLFENKLQLKEYDKYILLRTFSNKNLIIFDLLSFTKKINLYSNYKLEIKDLIEKIKNKSENYYIFTETKMDLKDFHNNLNIHYNMSLYENILLFIEYVNNNDNKFKNTSELDIDYFTSLNNIENSTESNYQESATNIQNEELYQSNLLLKNYNKKIKKLKTKEVKEQLLQKQQNEKLMNIFHKFAFRIKVKAKGDLDSFFEEYDINKNGLISKDEFLILLNSFDEFNEYEKMSMIKYASQNNFNEIPIRKLINIINSVSFDEEELILLEKEIEEELKKFESMIDFKELQLNFIENQRIKHELKNNIPIKKKFLYLLQKNLYYGHKDNNTIEKKFYDIAKNTESKVVTKDEFIFVLKDNLKNVKDYTENAEEFNNNCIEYSYSNSDNNINESLKENNLIPYQGFINYLVNFRIEN